MPPPSDILYAPHCVRCGYNLTGLDTARCPECGEPFDAATAGLQPRRRPVPDVEILLWLTVPPIATILGGLVVDGFYSLLQMDDPTLGLVYLIAAGVGLVFTALKAAHRIEWGDRVVAWGEDAQRVRWWLVVVMTIAVFAFYVVIVALLTMGLGMVMGTLR